MIKVAAGWEFTHNRILDPTWTPGEGQKYADAPKARMVVTHADERTVFYGHVGSRKAAWFMTREAFMARFVHPMRGDR